MSTLRFRGHRFRVRGKTYLSDRKKVPSAEPGFDLLGVELCATDAPDVLHISQYLPIVMHSSAAFLMPIHFTLPWGGKNMHLVCVFALRGLPDIGEEPFTAALGQYYAGTSAADDKRRRGALKMIPMVRICACLQAATHSPPSETVWICRTQLCMSTARPEPCLARDMRKLACHYAMMLSDGLQLMFCITQMCVQRILQVTEGSWVMRQAVGSTPFIIGNKLSTTYHRGARYLETTVDIQSNATAARITSYVSGALSSLSISLGFVLEGKVPEHLPEQLLGTVCLNHLDLARAKVLDTLKPLAARDVDGAGGRKTSASSVATGGTGGAHGGSENGAAGDSGASGALSATQRGSIAEADGTTPLQQVLTRSVSGQPASEHEPAQAGRAQRDSGGAGLVAGQSPRPILHKRRQSHGAA